MNLDPLIRAVQRKVNEDDDGKAGIRTWKAIYRTIVGEEWKDEIIVSPIDGARNITEIGADFIRSFEGLFLKAYKDSGGVWTIGWGHTGLQHLDGTVYPGRTITLDEAKRLFRYDMEQFEHRVSTLVQVALSDHQYDALVSFDFNTGGLTLDKGQPSTLLRKLNSGDYKGAANEFPKWNKDNGKTVLGLTRRRAAEKAMFEEGKYILNA